MSVLDNAPSFTSIGQKAEAINSNNAAQADSDLPVEEVESLCIKCENNGITRLLLTSIPYFREIIIMSFHCPHCAYQNNQIQPAGSIQPKGSIYELRLMSMADFGRQVIKSDTATIKFPELDLEIPPGRGQLTNVEGLLTMILDDLELNQEARKEQNPEVYEKIAELIARGRKMLAGEAFPLRVRVDDPAGNSFISPDMKDGVGKWEKHEYIRTAEQNAELGLTDTSTNSVQNDILVQTRGYQPGLTESGDIIPDEVYTFPATCPACMHNCVTNMKMVDIPHFKQVVLMSVVCDGCGFRSNDVKTGGAIPERGERIILRVRGEEDMSRDILKSEACAMECPELELSVNAGTLGGRFTTVEGLLTQVRNDLYGQVFNVVHSGVGGHSASKVEGGDSLDTDDRDKWERFFDNLDAAIRGERQFSVILSDPLAASYVQPLGENWEDDEQLSRESYERTVEEEEDLGIKDMKVEGYNEEVEKAKANVEAEAKETKEASA